MSVEYSMHNRDFYLFSGRRGSNSNMVLVMDLRSVFGLCGDCPWILSSMNGHWGMNRTRDFCFCWAGSWARLCICSSFKGRSTGCRSGQIDTFLGWFFRCFVPVSHWSLWARSTSRIMMPPLGFWDKRWHAEKRVASASSTFKTCFAKSLQVWRVVASSSPAPPSIPWITRFHCLRWTSIFWPNPRRAGTYASWWTAARLRQHPQDGCWCPAWPVPHQPYVGSAAPAGWERCRCCPTAFLWRHWRPMTALTPLLAPSRSWFPWLIFVATSGAASTLPLPT